MRAFNEPSAGQHQKVILALGSVQQPRELLLDRWDLVLVILLAIAWRTPAYVGLMNDDDPGGA